MNPQTPYKPWDEDVPEIDVDFLRKVIPDDGVLMITTITADCVHNIACSRFEDMAEKLASADRGSTNVYHANASFRTGESRTKTNAKSMKALRLDLDCGSEKASQERGYETKADAAIALRAFCEVNGLPRPLLVDSGGGLHAYWPLKDAVAVSEWEIAARILKERCSAHALWADSAVTADAARILRPVGSFNRKYDPPRRVKLLWNKGPFEFEELRNTLAAANPLLVRDARPSSSRKTTFTSTGSPTSLAEQVNPFGYDLQDVEKALTQIDPGCPREKWLLVGFAIADAFGEAGRDLFLRWSRGDLWEGA